MTFGHDVVEAEMEARRAAEQSGALYCSPYNDLQVTASHSTLVIGQHESTALVPSNDNSNLEMSGVFSPHTSAAYRCLLYLPEAASCIGARVLANCAAGWSRRP